MLLDGVKPGRLGDANKVPHRTAPLRREAADLALVIGGKGAALSEGRFEVELSAPSSNSVGRGAV